MTPPDNAPGWPARYTPPTVPADRDALVAEVARLRKALKLVDETLTGGFVRCAVCGAQEDTTDLDCMADVRAALADTAPRGGDGV
jgi:hypothetical protein